MNRNIATAHKRKMHALIDGAATSVTVRPPESRQAASNDVDKIFGSATLDTGYGTPITVSAWVHNASIPGTYEAQGVGPGAQILGSLSEADLILSVKLEDVLVDSTLPYGRTVFDKAKDVQVQGSSFKVKGTFRSGLAPIGPYILWIGLEQIGE